MDADLFLQQFGHLAQGDGCIKKLRDVILQLAVRGKLVEQNPADEPAEVLLKKIEAEKKRLAIKDRLSKTEAIDYLLSEIELPHRWTKTLLGNVVQIIRGITFPAQAKETVQTSDNIACLRTANVQKEVDWHDLIYVSREFVRNEEQIVQLNDILISLANSRELVGKTAIIKHCPVEATLGGFIGAIRPILVEPDFVNFFLSAPHVRAILIADANQTTNIANISGAKLNVITIPLPPLAEQKRIVAKVDELMALCDKLEAEQKAQATLKTQAVQSTLHHLRQAESPASLGTSLNILEHTFGNWFDDLATVKHLRATILQLALEGKLTARQEASEIEHKKVAELFELIDGDRGSNYPKADDYMPDGYCLFLSTKNVRQGEFVFSEKVFISEEKHNTLRNGLLTRGDIVLTTRGTIGNCAYYSDLIEYEHIRINSGMLILRPDLKKILPEFVVTFVKSPLFKTQIEEMRSGSAQPQLPAGILKKFIVPVPPLADQKRIVAKVDELMALCDQLESHIMQTQTLNTHLMDSLIHRMTEAA